MQIARCITYLFGFLGFIFFLETVRDSRLVLRYVGWVPVLNYHVWVLILIIIKLVTVEQTFHYLRL